VNSKRYKVGGSSWGLFGTKSQRSHISRIPLKAHSKIITEFSLDIFSRSKISTVPFHFNSFMGFVKFRILAFPICGTDRDGNGSVGHGSNGSRGSWDPLTHDDKITAQ